MSICLRRVSASTVCSTVAAVIGLLVKTRSRAATSSAVKPGNGTGSGGGVEELLWLELLGLAVVADLVAILSAVLAEVLTEEVGVPAVLLAALGDLPIPTAVSGLLV